MKHIFVEKLIFGIYNLKQCIKKICEILYRKCKDISTKRMYIIDYLVVILFSLVKSKKHDTVLVQL